MREITFNGDSSVSVGIRIERSPEIIRPRRKFDVISVPGRNGDYVIMQDAWENYIQPYDIFFGNGTDKSAEATAFAVSDWLRSANGYAKLVDSYEAQFYRMAYYVEETDIYNGLTQFGRATIHFNCRPERFYSTSGSDVANGATISNPTLYASRPLIKITGTGTWSGALTITNGASTYTIAFTDVDTSITLDCEEQNAFKGTINCNDKVSIIAGGDFPRLKPGNNVISWTMPVLAVNVDPRWFTI